jgi:SAM-dependent methyltransferase
MKQRSKYELKSVQTFEQDPSKYLRPPVCKEIFTQIYRILEQHDASSVLDFGCASGDFLYFLPEKISGKGIDKSKYLISVAESRNSKLNVNFESFDIFEESTLGRLQDYYDAVTILGTLHTFHDFRPLLNLIFKLNTKLIIIHSPFNEALVDTMHFHKDLSCGQADYQSAYNIFSRSTLEKYLKEKKVDHYSFLPFELSALIEKDNEYPMNCFHLTTDKGERYLTNGAGIIFKEYILKIHKSLTKD